MIQMSSSSSGGSDSTREGVGSPTSISSSVMSSNSSNINQPSINPVVQRNGDLSQSEAVSNISSPDFQVHNCAAVCFSSFFIITLNHLFNFTTVLSSKS